MSEPQRYYSLEIDAALADVKSTSEGLSQAQAQQRLHRYGPNRLETVKPLPRWRLFLRQFHNLLIYVLIAAAFGTALLQEWIDTAVIIAVVIINGLVGFIQEGKAEKALAAVRDLLAPHAYALRDGNLTDLEATELVPGDIVQLKAGDRVPADIRLLEVNNLKADEALLTGESLPVEKATDALDGDLAVADQNNMLWSGTLVSSGRGRGLVVATADNTELGRINAMLSNVSSLQTPLLRQLQVFGKQLTFVIVGLAIIAFALGFWIQDYEAREMFMAAVGLAVAAIPEGLPAVVTITLALGVQTMARRNAIVRRLPAVETLGSVTVICSDKTGTLTRNEMTATCLQLHEQAYTISGTGYGSKGHIEPTLSDDAQLMLRTALRCNDTTLSKADKGWKAEGAPTEMALALAAVKGGLNPETLAKQWQRMDMIPFDSAHKFMAVLDRDTDSSEQLILMSGAPEVLMQRCTHARIDGTDHPLKEDDWHQLIDKLANEGLRTLALAIKTASPDRRELSMDDLEEVTLLGLVGIIDPPRDEAITAIAACRSAGIQVKMITGDHAGTAKAIGKQLGIPSDEAITGKTLDAMSERELRDCAENTHIFARVSPENKLQLVTALQAQGEVVAMTGDGVNDAPALKRADIGVAMGKKGTEVAKEASEIVLADDNFASIERAVEEGRTVYANIRKSIAFIAPTNGGQALVILAAILIGMTIPVTPVHILWVNMVTAVTLALALAFEATEKDTMQQPPRNPQAGLIDGFMLWRIIFVSLIIVTFTFGLFTWVQAQGADLATARTVAVNTIVVLEIFYLFNSRFMTASSLSFDALRGNPYCWYAVGAVLVLQLLFTYLPWAQAVFDTRAISPGLWGLMAIGGVILFLLVELEKVLWRARYRRTQR
ncbi:cation-translocating P-type ATPase [Marinimicrobium alkaliphilum]|uniref:cation-translocating P-type ATPase n=1 Tax=Marinimicrobium alkaliphilum TaxID=2202654 RepID=UPI000DB9E8BB|nr:cation-transporting P-type ATPase [Marinimicrobium alkaliphilum]